MKINLFSKALLMGGMLAMVACSNDEPVIDNGNNNNAPIEGDVAYMNINIRNVNDGISRADNGGYEYGDRENESFVKSAKFMFFNADGNYMNIQTNKWTEGGYDKDENIEHFGANTIVLRGLKGENSYPSYMVTVLNYPSFEPGATLQATADKIVALTNKIDTKDCFIMSTTSYFDDGTNAHHENAKYFATKLLPGDFKKEPATTGTSNVDVYVERVAAKVTFGPSADMEQTPLEGSDDYGDYLAFKLNITVGGTENNEGDNEGLVEGDNEVYVRVYNWGLNATPKESYLSKKLNYSAEAGQGWNNVAPWTGWDFPTYYRSFWGMSTVYNQDIDDTKVIYTDYSSLKVAIKEAAYTHEHTNTLEKIVNSKGELDKTKVTSILVKARVVNKDGEGLDLVQIFGVNYTYNGFLGLVASNMATLERGMNYYYLDGTKEVPVLDKNGKPVYEQYEEDAEDGSYKKGDYKKDSEGNYIPKMQTVGNYIQLGTAQMKIVADGSGKTGAVTAAANIPADMEIYSLNAEGEYVINEQGAAQFAEDLNTIIEAYPKATAYNDGMMYYNIPIEHLNNAEPIAEGNYGIVRNHVYKVTFTKLTKMGHGIFNPGDGEDPTKPGEPIIPDDDEDDTYFLGSTVNILSWKVVEQEVEL